MMAPIELQKNSNNTRKFSSVYLNRKQHCIETIFRGWPLAFACFPGPVPTLFSQFCAQPSTDDRSIPAWRISRVTNPTLGPSSWALEPHHRRHSPVPWPGAHPRLVRKKSLFECDYLFHMVYIIQSRGLCCFYSKCLSRFCLYSCHRSTFLQYSYHCCGHK